MKCLMLLVLVAVCQGVPKEPQNQQQQIDQSKQQVDELRRVIEKYIPNVQIRESPRRQPEQHAPLQKTIRVIEQQREKLQHEKQGKTVLGREPTKFPFKTPIGTGRLSDKLPRPIRLETPFGQYSKPKTFLEYIKTFNQPWNQMSSTYPDVLDFKTFRDLIQFPGGDFLQNEIDKCLWNMPDNAQLPLFVPMSRFASRFPFDSEIQIDMRKVEGVRDVLPYILTKLEMLVPLYMETTSDPSTMAMLVTRDLIKIVLHGRMKCPTTTWDKFFIGNVNDQLYKSINDDKYQLLKNIRTILPSLFPEVSDATDQLVYTLTRDAQEHVFKDVMQYAHGVAFKDVAILCHKLYHEVKRVFEDSWQQDVSSLMQRLVIVVSDLVTNYGTCPRKQNYNTMACWDFKKLFLEREVARIHSRAMNIVHTFLYNTCNGEECMQYYPRMTEVLKTIIHRYISDMVERVPMCPSPECTDPSACLITKLPFLESPNEKSLEETRMIQGGD